MRHRVKWLQVIMAGLVFLTACTLPKGLLPTRLPTPTITPGGPPITPTNPAASATPNATPTVMGTPLYNAAAQLWFAPLPPLPQSGARPFIGSEDFMELFQPEAAWTEAAGRVNVFKLYGEWVAYTASKKQLAQVVENLKARRMALAVEVGPLTPTGQCGQGVESFAGEKEGRLIAQRILDAGGKIDYLALDEPYFYAHIYSGPNACHWSAEQIAQAVLEYNRVMRAVFPEVVVGDIEPLPYRTTPADYKIWLETYQQTTKTEMAFFHLDVDFTRADWPQLAQELETYTRSRGVNFGMLYFGADASDEAWIQTAWQRAGVYEARQGGRPDHVIFQSWNDHPDHTLPETDPTSFTHLINRYFRQRSQLQAEIGPSGGGNLPQLSGKLTSASGEAIGNVPIQSSMGIQYAPTILPAHLGKSLSGATDKTGVFALPLEQSLAQSAFIQVSYPGSETTASNGAAGFWPAYALLKSAQPARNLARYQPVIASAIAKKSDPAFAVDGDPLTVWNAGAGPRQYIEIDLGAPTTVILIRLLVSQSPEGWSTHWIWGKDTAGKYQLLEEVGTETAEWGVIDVWPETPWREIVAIRIETVRSPSWVAWREIEIIAP